MFRNLTQNTCNQKLASYETVHANRVTADSVKHDTRVIRSSPSLFLIPLNNRSKFELVLLVAIRPQWKQCLSFSLCLVGCRFSANLKTFPRLLKYITNCYHVGSGVCSKQRQFKQVTTCNLLGNRYRAKHNLTVKKGVAVSSYLQAFFKAINVCFSFRFSLHVEPLMYLYLLFISIIIILLIGIYFCFTN